MQSLLRKLLVSWLGFGCGGLSGIYNAPLSHEDGCSIIKQVFNTGVTFFDTSDLYGYKHDNEIMVGKALKELPRERVQLATKFGVTMSDRMVFGVKGTPEYVRECCEASLKRLDVSYIDLYYQHRVDTSVPIEDTMEELKQLVNEGKIRYIGLSEANADTIKRAHAVHPITALQMDSLWSRDIEEEIIPLCRELGIGIVAYSPLGRGFFARKSVAETLPSQSLLGHQACECGFNDKYSLLIVHLVAIMLRELGIGIVAYNPLGHGFFVQETQQQRPCLARAC